MKKNSVSTISFKEYQEVHNYLKNTYGSATECEFCKIKDRKKYDWALRKGYQYCKDIKCFLQLCRSCHLKYDFTEERTKKNQIARLGIKNNAQHNEALRKANLGKINPNSFKIKIINLFESGKTRAQIIKIGFKERTVHHYIQFYLQPKN